MMIDTPASLEEQRERKITSQLTSVLDECGVNTH